MYRMEDGAAMNTEEILQCIDHTLLRPTATLDEVRALCEEGISLKTASICIPPCYVWQINNEFKKQIPVCTVIGFPLGYNSSMIKFKEVEKALSDGADELDIVINIGDVKSGDYDKVLDEITGIKYSAEEKIVKVIIETCYLTREEKIKMCEIVSASGADYIKTSTGLGSLGAVLEDIQLFKEHLDPSIKIKAAGGIKTREDMIRFIEAGCSRIGTSSAKVLVQ